MSGNGLRKQIASNGDELISFDCHELGAMPVPVNEAHKVLAE